MECKNIIQGHSDSALTLRGERQTSALLAAFAESDYRVECVYASPLGRAWQMGQRMAERFYCSLIAEPALKEQWCVVVEEVELRNALAVEIPKHHPCFLVAMSVSPDYIEAFRRRGNYVPAILGWRKQLYRCAVAVIWLVERKGAGFDKSGDKPAVLMLAAKFLGCARCIAAYRLSHTISCFTGANSSRPRHGSPRSSRTVLSRTTLKCFRINLISVSAS
ncbi:phosphoglycerate mutase [Klebsiella pneumoniae RYC492]|nr:phosphoglycerate mutase [Klebsiella pneumoniae RYC492]